MKPDAQALWDRIRNAGDADGETPRDIGRDLGIHPKRVASLCARWAKKGVYEYGVAVDLGWKTSRAVLEEGQISG